MNQGFIYFWRKDDLAGNIHGCSGSAGGLNFGFGIDDCDNNLQAKLKLINFIGFLKKECPPPSGVICVNFDFFGASASNVSETTC